MNSRDYQIRLAAFNWLSSQVDIHGDVLSRDLLAKGFEFNDQRVPLLGPQGIFKPQVLDRVPISITTSPNGPYDDSFSSDGLLNYKYRGTDPNHHENRGLREAYRAQTPLIYFHGIVPGKYMAVWPVFIVGDSPEKLSFSIAVDDAMSIGRQPDLTVTMESAVGRREYITAATKVRLHQSAFRIKVLRAYREQCALCRLKHPELLDAAHIIPDSHAKGDPIVGNGLSLCKIHHAAFDKQVLGISPDYLVEIREDILEEVDGPMLKHGIQSMHGVKIVLPRSRSDWPDRERLAERYERFQRTA